jgi:nucleoid DNA-binding protein
MFTYESSKTVSKRMLGRYVLKKLNGAVPHVHVLCILNILFEEIVEEWKNNRKLQIHHFGMLYLEKLSPRRTWHPKQKVLKLARRGRNWVRWKLHKELRRKIYDALDISSLESYDRS